MVSLTSRQVGHPKQTNRGQHRLWTAVCPQRLLWFYGFKIQSLSSRGQPVQITDQVCVFLFLCVSDAQFVCVCPFLYFRALWDQSGETFFKQMSLVLLLSKPTLSALCLFLSLRAVQSADLTSAESTIYRLWIILKCAAALKKWFNVLWSRLICYRFHVCALSAKLESGRD